MSNHTNSLVNETSPYLLQHATNPVHWYPWAATALEKARQENKPILLSIGYSACHWCHVMAHESFEDEETASIMNDLFVNIKVDREERPDLDKIYQTAHQILTQRGGGWPLTVFLAPDTHAPFFAGTYFPKLPRYGMPAFKDLLKHVAHNFHNNHEELREQNSQFLDFLAHSGKQQRPHQGSLNVDPLEKARFELEQHFDAEHGGFGAAPKFPHPTNLDRLLRHWAMTQHTANPDKKALTMATKTLKKMAQGGIYDQLGGGFCRYSVDVQWLIPHFEKMLYDNGPLLELYATLWQVTNDSGFRHTAEDIGNWFIHQMQSPEGGFYSSIDADSEGVEGKFYVWQREDIRSLLDDDEYALIESYFGLDKPANFEGHWHLFIADDTQSFGKMQGDSLNQWQTQLNNARSKLLAARNKRIAPGRDEKILTSWNALAIKGLANAGRLLQRPDFINAASTALDFTRSRLWQNNRLLATYKEGRAHLTAYLDDYAFLLDATLTLLQARWRDEDLDFAIALADTLLTQFEDGEQGGFLFTANDHEPLIQRPRHFADDALPSGNGVAAYSLARLGHLLGETRYLDATERCLKAGWQSIIETPFAHNAMLAALEETLFPPQLIFLRGNESQMQIWQHRCTETYEPRRLVFAITQGGERLPGSQDIRSNDSVVAYRCDGFACSAPITSLDQLLSEIN